MERTNRCQHDEAKADPIVRAETCFFVGNQIIESVGCYLALFNCQFCGTTISVPLPGHVDFDDEETDEWEPPTVVRYEQTPACPRREPVAERDGFVAAEVAL